MINLPASGACKRAPYRQISASDVGCVLARTDREDATC